MAPKLSDISRLVQAALREYSSARDKGDLQLAWAQLYGLNRMMPPDRVKKSVMYKYRVMVNTTMYAEITARETYAECPTCGEMVTYEHGQLGSRHLTVAQRAGMAVQYGIPSDSVPHTLKTWRCPDKKCGASHDMATPDGRPNVRIGQPEVSDPQDLGCVPKAPTEPPPDQIQAHERWQRDVIKWLDKFYVELMGKVAEYRRDYIAQGKMLDEGDYDGAEERGP